MFFALQYYIFFALLPAFPLAHNASMPLTVPYSSLVRSTVLLEKFMAFPHSMAHTSAGLTTDAAQHNLQAHSACSETFSLPSDESAHLTLADFNISYDDTASPITFVNIWATWCAPCRAELPILIELEEKTDAAIAIRNLGDSPEAIKAFADEIGSEVSRIGEQAPEDILQTINAQGLPYNAVFSEEQLIGVRNQAIHDDSQLSKCLNALMISN